MESNIKVIKAPPFPVSPSTPSSASVPTGSPPGFLMEFGQKVVGALGTLLTDTLRDIATLEIKTFTSDFSEAPPQTGTETSPFEGTRLRAFTRFKLDGDIEHCVPTRNGEIDQPLWTIHNDVVQQAQRAREQAIKTVVSTVTGLFKPGRDGER